MSNSLSSPGPLSQLTSMGLFVNRVTDSILGRPAEVELLRQQLANAERGMACAVLEGEPGIGKTRLLVELREMAQHAGFITIEVTADEEIRGPFLVARSLLASPQLIQGVGGTPAEASLKQAVAVVSNDDDPGLARLAPDQKTLRIFDLSAVAFREAAAVKPIAILIDDLQWADEDSLRLLRYVARTVAASRILLVTATRASEIVFVEEAVNLLADLDRMGLQRHVKLGRFNSAQTVEFLERLLGGKMDPAGATVMQAQSEGVPFVLAEQVQAYRENGLIHQTDGVWRLAPNSERLQPSAVRTLIQRRAANLPQEVQACLADAAVLGRSFNLGDLMEIRRRAGEQAESEAALAELLAPSVSAGLLEQRSNGAGADFSFAHDQIRQYSAAALPAARRKALHLAIVDMLTAGGEPRVEALPTIVQHAMAAGSNELCSRAAIASARASIAASAPEEALRVIEVAQPVAASAQDRVDLLTLRDDALSMLRRATPRLEGLAELGALAEALGQAELEMDVLLRRAAAFRLSNDMEVAASLARRVRETAVQQGNRKLELLACIELGQDLLAVEMGEAYAQNPSESDLDGSEEAYLRAAEVAEEIGDESLLAAAYRELGVIKTSRLRAIVVAGMLEGHHLEIIKRIAGGETLDEVLSELPEPARFYGESAGYFQKALDIYDRLGNKQGSMSTVIGLATLSWAPEIHLGGSAHRIEELRRLISRLKSFTKESERALADAQMLYGSHVYARAKVFPDFAITKGEEAYMASLSLSDHSLQFAAAGGTALAYLDMEMQAEAERWQGRAAAIAASAPSSQRSRQLSFWRGLLAAGAGDAASMREYFEQALRLSQEAGLPAERCEYHSYFAMEAARLGRSEAAEELLELAQNSAEEAKRLASSLPGHAPWAARAEAASAMVWGARGRLDMAAEAGRVALAAVDAAMQEDLLLDILIPAAKAVLEVAQSEEAAALKERLALNLSVVAHHMLDEDMRTRWFRGRTGSALVRLAGGNEPAALASPNNTGALTPGESELLSLITQGLSNEEIAQRLSTGDDEVNVKIGELFLKIGVMSRAGATATALLGRLI